MLRGQLVCRALSLFTGRQPVGTRLSTAQQGTQLLNLGGFEQPTKRREPVQSSEHGFDLAGEL